MGFSGSLSVSRASRRVGPVYQGVSPVFFFEMFAPLNADSGMKSVVGGLVPDHLHQRRELLLDLLEPLLVVVDHVHLVDGHDQLLDTERAGQEDVLLGLLHHAVGGRDHEDGRVGLGGARDHVLDEVTVARAVHDREVELRRVEPLVGDVDRDPALALLLEVVHDPRELEGALALGLGLLSVVLDDVRGDRAGLEHQSSDQRRLSVVDVADDGQVQVRLVSCHYTCSSRERYSILSGLTRVLHIRDASI